ncbi:putative harbinger transposase-derived protein [Helianthus debilis subsp. tardiflorus]
MVNYYYRVFFADDGESTDEEVEHEAVMSACQLAVRYVKHCRRPERETKTRDYIERDRRAAHDRLMKVYFDEAPTFSNPEVFRRRFRISKRLFLRIVDDLETNYDYFKQKADAEGTLGFTGIQKCTSTLRVLAYGNTTDTNDEIYPRYSIVVKAFSDPIDEKRAHFKKVQESSRKDIERCFGVLKQRWHNLRDPCRAWTKQKMRDAMYACIIMHNMILEDEGNAICQNYVPEAVQEEHPQASMGERVNNARELRYEPYHSALTVDLVQQHGRFGMSHLRVKKKRRTRKTKLARMKKAKTKTNVFFLNLVGFYFFISSIVIFFNLMKYFKFLIKKINNCVMIGRDIIGHYSHYATFAKTPNNAPMLNGLPHVRKRPRVGALFNKRLSMVLGCDLVFY